MSRFVRRAFLRGRLRSPLPVCRRLTGGFLREPFLVFPLEVGLVAKFFRASNPLFFKLVDSLPPFSMSLATPTPARSRVLPHSFENGCDSAHET